MIVLHMPWCVPLLLSKCYRSDAPIQILRSQKRQNEEAPLCEIWICPATFKNRATGQQNNRFS